MIEPIIFNKNGILKFISFIFICHFLIEGIIFYLILIVNDLCMHLPLTFVSMGYEFFI